MLGFSSAGMRRTPVKTLPPPAPPSPRLISFAPPGTRLAALAEELKRTAPPPPLSRLDDIALTLRSMDYGSFMEFAEAIDANPARLWKWATERECKL